MKTLLVIALVLLILLAGCVISVRYIVNSAQGIISLVDEVADAIDAERWPEAGQAFVRAQAAWTEVEKHWKIIINHDDMRDIQLGFVHLSVALAHQDQWQAIKELRTLRYYLNHVPESERVEIGNVL